MPKGGGTTFPELLTFNCLKLVAALEPPNKTKVRFLNNRIVLYLPDGT